MNLLQKMGAPLDFNAEPSTDSAGQHSLLNDALTGALTVGKVVFNSNAQEAKPDSPKSTGITLQGIVMIVLGLILVAAGIFSFREIRQTVISSGKTAAKAAAIL